MLSPPCTLYCLVELHVLEPMSETPTAYFRFVESCMGFSWLYIVNLMFASTVKTGYVQICRYGATTHVCLLFYVMFL